MCPKAIGYGRGIELQASDEEGDKLGNGSGCCKMDATDVLTLQMQVGGIRLCCMLSCPLNSDGESQPRLSAIFPHIMYLLCPILHGHPKVKIGRVSRASGR